MSSMREQCDFMSTVVQRAILMGMSREQFDKLVDTAWLVLTAEQPDREWLIRKRGYYYRPDRAGYTASVFAAGRYTEAEAKAEAAIEPSIIEAIPYAKALRDATTQETAAARPCVWREGCKHPAVCDKQDVCVPGGEETAADACMAKVRQHFEERKP